MDDTQLLEDCVLNEGNQPELYQDTGMEKLPLATLRVFKNMYFPETEVPLYLGENVLGRDPTSCLLPLSAGSLSKRHAVISLSIFPANRPQGDPIVEALLWDLGSLNGTRMGRIRLSPNVRYALNKGESVVLANLPCQYMGASEAALRRWQEGQEAAKKIRGRATPRGRGRGRGRGLRACTKKICVSGVEDCANEDRCISPHGNGERVQMGKEPPAAGRVRNTTLSLAQTPSQPEKLLVLESDSDSDGEIRARRGVKAQFFASDSDSPHPSPPTCSSFLSPENHVVRESEDETSVTPIRTDQNSGCSHLRRTLVMACDSDVKVEMESPRVADFISALENKTDESETSSNRTGPIQSGKDTCERVQGINKLEATTCTDVPLPSGTNRQPCGLRTGGDPAGEDEAKVEQKVSVHGSEPDGHASLEKDKGYLEPERIMAPDGSSVAKLVLSLDSDTDAEVEEGDGQLSGPVSGTRATELTSVPPDTPIVQQKEFHLDSDTDAEGEEGDGQLSGPVSGTGATELTSVPPDTPIVQQKEFHLDSDTDAEGNVDDMPSSSSMLKTNVNPISGPELIPADFHLDSDTDAEEDQHDAVESEESNTGQGRANMRTPENLDSDTDAEGMDNDPFVASESRTHLATSRVEVGLAIQSDSDSDVEINATQLYAAPGLQPQEYKWGEPSSTTVVTAGPDSAVEPGFMKQDPEPPTRPSGAVEPSGFYLDSDTDVEEEGEQRDTVVLEDTALPQVAGHDMGSRLLEQKCSTPVSSDPSVPSLLRPKHSEEDQDDTKEDDSDAAETQPDAFTNSVLNATQPYAVGSFRAEEAAPANGMEEQTTQLYPFQLGASDSRLTQGTPAVHAEEDELLATQAYISDPAPVGSGSIEMEGELEATQAYPSLLVTSSTGTAVITQMGENIQVLTTEKHQTPKEQAAEEVRKEEEEVRKEVEEESMETDFHADSHLSTADTQPVSALEAGHASEARPEAVEEAEEEEEEVKSLPVRGRRRRRGDAQPSSSSRTRRGGGVEEEGASSQAVSRSTQRSARAERTKTLTGVKVSEEECDEEQGDAVEQESIGTGKRKARKSTMSRRQKEKAERQRLEHEEQERLEHEEQERLEHEEQERLEHEEQERLEHEAKEQEKRGMGEGEKAAQGEQHMMETKERHQEERTECEEQRPDQDEQNKTVYREQGDEGDRRERGREESGEEENLERESERPEKEETESEEKESLGRGGTERQENKDVEGVEGQAEMPQQHTEEEEKKGGKEKLARGRQKQGRKRMEEEEGAVNEEGENQRSSGRGTRQASRRSTAVSAVSADKPALVAKETGNPESQPGLSSRSRCSSVNSISSESNSSVTMQRKAHDRKGRRGAELHENSAICVPSGEEPALKASSKARAGKRRVVEVEQPGTGEEAEEEARSQCGPTSRKGRAATAKKVKQEEGTDPKEGKKELKDSVGSVQQKGRGRQAVGRRKGGSQGEMSEADQSKCDAPTSNAEDQDRIDQKAEAPQTPVSRGSRKRAASDEPPPVAKTPRRSCGASPRVRNPQTHKVLFTGVTDDAGEQALIRLGGSVARGVADMTLLVTDRVRRTVKFLCAVARGVPIVTPNWLEKCSKNSTFLSPEAFLVKDVEQEKKFDFCLEHALQAAHTQPLLQGYEIHVTRSVKPEPAQMKDIITCSGARYLPKMPTVHKPQTLVISCPEDAALCAPAHSASVPVLSAEFLLTGILQQKVDLIAHSLVGTGFEAPVKAGPKGRKRK